MLDQLKDDSNESVKTPKWLPIMHITKSHHAHHQVHNGQTWVPEYILHNRWCQNDEQNLTVTTNVQ